MIDKNMMRLINLFTCYKIMNYLIDKYVLIKILL